MKNVVNVVARENLALDNEPFCVALAQKFFQEYPQVDSVSINALETKWVRLPVDGVPHAHSFVLDNNGKNYTNVEATREAVTIASGVARLHVHEVDQLRLGQLREGPLHDDPRNPRPDVRDQHGRHLALEVRAGELSRDERKIIETMLKVFAGTYSESVQDSLYRMGTAALAAVPELIDITMACPNKHYLLINLSPFKMDNDNQVFLPTDEPHGQIECTVGR